MSRTTTRFPASQKNSDERYKFDTYTQHVLKNSQTTQDYEDKTKQRFY